MSTGEASRSGGAQGDGTPAIIESAPTILTAAPGPALVVPHDAFLLEAGFARVAVEVVRAAAADDVVAVVAARPAAAIGPPAVSSGPGKNLPDA